uniref:Uncharacterized protein n=1 Tax=Rhizophora mucronata TaxID=61149 RepID=A0A2P2PE76_RHIMU
MLSTGRNPSNQWKDFTKNPKLALNFTKIVEFSCSRDHEVINTL